MKRFSFIIFSLALLPQNAFSQQIPFGSQYYQNSFLINPAFTGSGDGVNAFLMHRSQFSGISGSPQTSRLTVDGPLNNGIGLGLNVYSDVTSIISRTGAAANYSYALNLGNEQTLTFGLAAGIIDHSINYEQAVVRDVDDPSLFSDRVHRTSFSADAGIAYTWKRLQAGFAIPQMFSGNPRIKSNTGTKTFFDMDRHYQGTVKYTFDIDAQRGITAYPLVMFRTAFGTPFQYDINAVVDWKSIGWAGITYHSNYAMALSVGVRYKNLSIGYAHDFGVSQIRKYTGSSDEFMLSYNFGNETKKRLDQHEKDIAELQQRNEQNEQEIKELKEDVTEIREELADIHTNEIHFRDSLLQVIYDMDAVKSDIDEERALSTENKPAKEMVKEPGKTSGAYRTHGAAEFLDEEGNPLPKGYYVVIGSFGVKNNAYRFRDDRLNAGESTTMITFHQAISIYNVYVLRSDDYSEAHAERMKQLKKYANTWVLKLE